VDIGGDQTYLPHNVNIYCLLLSNERQPPFAIRTNIGNATRGAIFSLRVCLCKVIVCWYQANSISRHGVVLYGEVFPGNVNSD
jgi:hypothetical protein